MKVRRLVIFSSLPEVGGHTTTTLKLCELLQPMFEEICVITKDIPGHGFSEAAREELLLGNVRVFRVSTAKLGDFLRTLSLCRGADVFLAIGMRHLSPVLALLIGARQSFYYHITHELSPAILRQLRVYRRFFSRLVFLSPATARLYAESTGHPGPSAWAVQPTALPQEPACLPQRAPGPVRLGLLGRLTEEKGVGLLSALVEKSPVPCELHTAGRGPKEAELLQLRRAHPDRVVFEGAYTARERGSFLAQFFSQIDYLCVPSLDDREGIPNVILEALQSGVPVLATKTGGMRSFAMSELGPADPDVVRLVEPDEFAAAFAVALRSPLPSPETRNRCMEYFERQFSDQVIAVHWHKILSEPGG